MSGLPSPGPVSDRFHVGVQDVTRGRVAAACGRAVRPDRATAADAGLRARFAGSGGPQKQLADSRARRPQHPVRTAAAAVMVPVGSGRGGPADGPADVVLHSDQVAYPSERLWPSRAPGGQVFSAIERRQALSYPESSGSPILRMTDVDPRQNGRKAYVARRPCASSARPPRFRCRADEDRELMARAAG